MTDTINIYEAKTQLSRLVDRASAGEDIVIARAGKPLVRLVPVTPQRRLPPAELHGLPCPENMFAPMSDEELDEWE